MSVVSIIFIVLFVIVFFGLPFVRWICRSSLDPRTQIPHRKMASLAALFTVIGLFTFFPFFLYSFTQPMHRSGGHSMHRDRVRAEAFDAELDAARERLQESLKAASDEDRPRIEATLKGFEQEYEKSRSAFGNEDEEYSNQLDAARRNVNSRFASQRQGFQMIPVMLFAFLSLTTTILIGPGSIFGWWYLKRIRLTPEKPGWIRAMFAALLFPCFLLWFIPMLIGVAVGAMVAKDFTLPSATSQFLGGLVAFGFSLLLIALTIWLVYRWVFPKQNTQAKNESNGNPQGSMKFTLAVSILAVVALFVSTLLATGFYVPKWTLEGKGRFVDGKIRSIQYRIDNGDGFYGGPQERKQPTEEDRREKKELYQSWLVKFEKLKEKEIDNLARWERENQTRIALCVWTPPLVVAFVLCLCGGHVFYRLCKGDTNGIVSLVFVFAIVMFFVPLSLQYVTLCWWSGSQGYWDDQQGGILALLFLLTFVIVLPTLILFFRRSIKLTKSHAEQPLPPTRVQLASGITLASILVSIVAFAYVGLSVFPHDKRYQCNYDGERVFMEENTELRDEIISQYKKIFDRINEVTEESLPDHRVWLGYDADLLNELSWIDDGRWRHPSIIDHFRTRPDSTMKILLAVYCLSFMFAVPSGTVGMFLGLGYLRRNRVSMNKKERTYAAISVGALPLMALLLLLTAGIGWMAMQKPDSGAAGLFAVNAMVYLLVVSVVFGFIAVLFNTSKS